MPAASDPPPLPAPVPDLDLSDPIEAEPPAAAADEEEDDRVFLVPLRCHDKKTSKFLQQQLLKISEPASTIHRR